MYVTKRFGTQSFEPLRPFLSVDPSLWFNLRMNQKIRLHSQTKYFWNRLNEEYSKSSKFFKSYDGLFLKSILFMPSAKDKLQFKDP